MKLNPRQYDLQDFDDEDDKTNSRIPNVIKGNKPVKKTKTKMRDEYTKRDNKKFNKPHKLKNSNSKYDD